MRPPGVDVAAHVREGIVLTEATDVVIGFGPLLLGNMVAFAVAAAIACARFAAAG